MSIRAIVVFHPASGASREINPNLFEECPKIGDIISVTERQPNGGVQHFSGTVKKIEHQGREENGGEQPFVSIEATPL